MITVKERVIEVDANSMRLKLIELSKLLRKQNYIAFNLKMINSEFKLKLTLGDYLRLFETLCIPVRRGMVYFDSLEETNVENPEV